jgi:flagellar M-ring protein FliF
MDYLKSQLDRIQQQLGSLSASQKMLTAVLVAIMVVTIVMWGRYAGQNELVPVLDQALSQSDIARMTAKIQSRGITYRVVGDQVLVPADRRLEVIADLGYNQLLPRDTRRGFDEITRQMSPWNSNRQNEVLWRKDKELTLAEVFMRWPEVVHATVLLDITTERRIGQSVHPVAVVNLSMRDQMRPPQKMIEAAADVVVGAQAGLSRSRVTVSADGISYPLRDRDDDPLAMSPEVIEQIKAHERRLIDKIQEQFGDIRGLLVSVTVDLNVQATVEDRVVYGDIRTADTEIQSTTEEMTGPSRMGMEPGAVPNIGMAIPEGPLAGAGGTSMRQDETIRSQVFPETIRQQIRTPAGRMSVVAASVRVPRSHLVRVYKQRFPSAGEPDETALQSLIEEKLLKIRNHVKMSTGLDRDELVAVDTYTDVMTAMAPSIPGSSNAMSMSSIMGSHGKEVVLGALALISLFMAMMMVRKGSPAPAGLALAEPRPAPKLPTGEDLAGQAAEGKSLLHAMELDEEAVRAQQVIDQVSNMVKDDPDAAANLVKRWMNRM